MSHRTWYNQAAKRNMKKIVKMDIELICPSFLKSQREVPGKSRAGSIRPLATVHNDVN